MSLKQRAIGIGIRHVLVQHIDRMVAVQLALLVTCFEAISLKGNDNLLVPVVTCLILIVLILVVIDRISAFLRGRII